MFEFVNERLINSAIDAYSGRPKFESLDNKTFRIYRFGTFDSNFIVNRTIYKTRSSQPVKPVIEITITDTIIPNDESVKNIRLMVDLRLSGSVNSEYSTYNSRVKAKPMVANLAITKNDTKEKIAAAFVQIFKDQDYLYDNLRVNFSLKDNGSNKHVIVITGETEFQYFNNVEVQELVPWNTAALGTYYPVEPVWVTLIKYDAGSETTRFGKEGFGTYWTMLKNVQIQNSNRTDVFSVDNDDTRLIPGASYTQYVLDYRVKRDITGMQAVGQELVSITKHIMWVNDAIVSDFDKVLQASGIIIEDIGNKITEVSVTPESVSVIKTASQAVTVTTTPAGGNFTARILNPEVASITIEGTTITVKGVETTKQLETQLVIEFEDGIVKSIPVTVTTA